MVEEKRRIGGGDKQFCSNCIDKVMPREEINIVWIKRDWRSQDHAPLQAAEQANLPYLIIGLFEPSIIQYPDTSLRHLQFIYHSYLALRKRLEVDEKLVELCYAEALEVFEALTTTYRIREVFSYQESGIRQTWDRDRAVAKYLVEKEIIWTEFQRDGILRGIKNRKGWEKRWQTTANSPLIKNVYTVREMQAWKNPFLLPTSLQESLENYPSSFQPAGEHNGWRYLKSFVEGRGYFYQKHISKPSESRLSCGRVSPYLAWGNLSVKQVYQYVKHYPYDPRYERVFYNFLTRLLWRCHFIQKFETACEYESDCINPGFELLEREERTDWIEAWKSGHTGYPLIDACMRCVVQTGWINFRMRAMLVSFLCHQLDQDWRSGSYHLAQQFLDYEPGIHYPQFQMQAGTTGINTVRMYNPIKQSKDHDPEGIFIKKWIPELGEVPTANIHEPWKMTELEQAFCGFKPGRDYPLPLVDLEESSKKAREKIWGHRQHAAVKAAKVEIIERLTNKKK